MAISTVNLATWRILAILGACEIVNMLDRTNVGIAALRMAPDIGLSATAYGLGAGIFYAGYFLFEVPSNLMLHRVGARRWIFRIMLSWGLVSMCMAFVSSERSFYIMRFLLGLTEAGFFPGVMYYLSQWFDRRSLPRAVGLLFAMIPVSMAIGAPVSTGLLVTFGWRWLFVLEAVPAVLMAFVVLLKLPDTIEDAPWLSPGQKVEMTGLMAADGHTPEGHSWLAAFSDLQTILLTLQYFFLGLGAQALGAWLPQIIHSLGINATWSGLFSTTPWLLAAILTPLWTMHSVHTNERYWHAILPCVIAAAIFAVLPHFSGEVAVTVGLISFGMALNTVAGASFWAIPRRLVTGGAAATGFALTSSFGNLAGLVGPYFVGFMKDRTGNFSLLMVLLAGPLIASALLSMVAGRMADPAQKRAGLWPPA